MPAIVAPGGNLLHFVPSSLGAARAVRSRFRPRRRAPTPAAAAACARSTTSRSAWRVDQLDTWVLFRAPCWAWSRRQPRARRPVRPHPQPRRRQRGAQRAPGAQRVAEPAHAHRPHAQRDRRRRGAPHRAALRRHLRDRGDGCARNGVRFVPISANYYDDLPTRLDLEPALVERMRAAGVLFDRSAGGRLPAHLHREPGGQGVFFEIVQRIGAYDGYGSTNAPARMALPGAAQALIPSPDTDSHPTETTMATSATPARAARQAPDRKAAASGWIGSALEYYDFFIYATAASLIFPQIFFPQGRPDRSPSSPRSRPTAWATSRARSAPSCSATGATRTAASRCW